MKFEKIVLSLSVTAFLLTAAHEGLAATKIASTKTDTTTATTQKSGKKVAKKTVGKKTVAKNAIKKPTRKKMTRLEREEAEIEKEISAYEVAAVSPAVRSNSVISEISDSTKSGNTDSGTSTRTKISQVKKEKPAQDTFGGSVTFTAGNDNNIDPDKTRRYDGAFYQIEPALTYKSGNWSGGFGANIKDFADAEHSELFRTSEAKGNGDYTVKISDVTSSTTSLSFLYHDERWPDYIDGDVDAGGDPVSMPIRFSEFKISQSMDFNFESVSTKIGGSYANRDYYNLYTDYASEPLRELRHERDYNEISLFGRVGLKAASFLELAAKPSVTQKSYTKREARLPNGNAGGVEANSPLYELLISEIGFDAAFTFGGSNITPTAVVGQTSDEGLGAEDNSYYGVGLNAAIVLDKATKMTITPSFLFKRISYDNWTASIQPIGDKRQEDETTGGITASVNLAKNFGVNVAYNVVREKTNIVGDTSEEYKQEIISSGLMFMF